ncbi:MAG TPA: 3-hydroxyacyl-CoA dehydrogenase NAD-binding domain-containing protein, partial [Myxococcales bacterium]|nr:3-hydroxyacyl-CoA dehydrogenase NAD-binding domain-containing protein [Myxococcales bacterium]
MDVSRLAVVGAGQMGAGIAQVAAQAGLSVVLVDVQQAFIDKGLAGIKSQLEKASAKGKLKEDAAVIFARVRGGSAQDARDAQFAVEAVTENEVVKKKVFADLAASLSDTAILATNTSSIPITRMAA